MHATTTRTNNATHTAGAAAPAPRELHQRPGAKGDTRQVVMNGSRLWLEHTGTHWLVVRQEAAPFNR